MNISDKWKKTLFIIAIVAVIEFSGFGILASLFELLTSVKLMKIKILISIFNDWQSVFKLLENINYEVLNLGHEFSVIIVNDASTEIKPELSTDLDNLSSIKIINMKENRGHARCNAFGIKVYFENEEFDYVIPMDSDGEDRPEEIKNFLQAFK